MVVTVNRIWTIDWVPSSETQPRHSTTSHLRPCVIQSRQIWALASFNYTSETLRHSKWKFKFGCRLEPCQQMSEPNFGETLLSNCKRRWCCCKPDRRLRRFGHLPKICSATGWCRHQKDAEGPEAPVVLQSGVCSLLAHLPKCPSHGKAAAGSSNLQSTQK